MNNSRTLYNNHKYSPCGSRGCAPTRRQVKQQSGKSGRNQIAWREMANHRRYDFPVTVRPIGSAGKVA